MTEVVRVLYVDQGNLSHAIVRTLEEEQIHLIRAEDGVDALKRLDLEPIDVVIVPDKLPALPIRRFVERVQTLEPGVSILVSGERSDLPPEVFQVSTGASGRKLRDRLDEIIADRTLDRGLESQDRLEGVAFEITHAVVTATDEEAILNAFYDTLTHSDLFNFVWVWRYDQPDGALLGTRPLAGQFTPTDVTQALAIGDPNFVAEAIQSATLTVARSDDLTRSSAAVDSTPNAAPGSSRPTVAYAAVPFSVDGETYGIALLGADRSDAFDNTECTLLGKLGTIVGESLATAGQRRRGPQPPSNPERISQFVDVFAHELRNPLQIAQSYLEMGRDGMDEDSLERVKTAHNTIEEIIASVVQMAGGGGFDEVTEVDVTNAATDSWQRVRNGSAELTVGKPVTVSADPDLLDRLLSNLFSNAIDHAGPDVSVRVGALPDDAGFFVEDNGPGIPETDRETVLEWGFSTGDDHLGIGLGFIREIAEAHDWTIAITEGRDGGARFEFVTDRSQLSTDGGFRFHSSSMARAASHSVSLTEAF